jgi:nondiscriminating glutamyl-tRNA synthetase
MKKLDLDKVVELSLPHLVKAGKVSNSPTQEEQKWAKDLVALYQEKMSFGGEIVELSDLFFKTEIEYDEEAKVVLAEEQVPEVMKAFLNELNGLEVFGPEEIKKAIKATQKETGQKGKKLFMPIRVATTGQTHGPDLPQAISLLGKEKITKRLEQHIG